MVEEPLTGQSGLAGDAMRSLQYFQIPGIDLLADRLEFMTAKQAQSAAHQAGRIGVMSELYGVTGWGFELEIRTFVNQTTDLVVNIVSRPGIAVSEQPEPARRIRRTNWPLRPS
jgi:hypothetical protein